MSADRFAYDRFLVDQLVRPIANLYQITPLAADVLDPHVVQGYSASLPDAAAKALARDPRVAYVEPDATFTADAT